MTAKYIFTSILALLLIILCSSCENEIPFNKAAKPPRLIMNAFINADSTNNVLLLNLTGSTVISDVTDATVEVRINDALVESPQPIPFPTGDFRDTQKRFRITSKFNPGDKVRIDARTGDGVHHAWAEVTVPQPPLPITQVDTVTIPVNIYDNYYENKLRFRITFADHPGEKNFYRLVLERRACLEATLDGRIPKDTLVMKQNYKIITREDMVLTDGHPSMSDNDNSMFDQPLNIYGIFDDSRISGQTYTMTVYMDTNNLPYLFWSHTLKREWMDCYVRLLSISETDYQYFKALNVIDSDAYDATLMEPLTFASNVHGGVGIVSISTETSVKLNLSDKVYDSYQ